MVQGKRFLKDPKSIQRRVKPGAAFGPKKAEQQKKRSKLTSVKNQIRAVKRLLAKGGLASKAVADQQRRLEQLTDTLQEHQKAEKQRKYASKYHKVRFFERVKIERQITRLKRESAPADAAAAAERAAQLAALQDDLTYVIHFPKEEKYVSLLRQAEDPAAQAPLDAQRARLRALARVQAADAALVAEPDEGRSLRPASQTLDQAADSSEQDDFFLASDDERLDTAAAGDGSAGGASDAAAFERAADAAGAAQPAGLKGKGGKQRQRPLGINAGLKPGAALHSKGRQQQQQSKAAPKGGAQPSKRPRLEQFDGRQQPVAASSPQQKQQKRPLVKPAASASAVPAMQHRNGASNTAQQQHKQQRHQAAHMPLSGKLSSLLSGQPKVNHAANMASDPISDVTQPKPGQPVRKRAEGGRKRRKKG